MLLILINDVARCWYAIKGCVKYEYYQIEVCVKVGDMSTAKLVFKSMKLPKNLDLLSRRSKKK